MSDTSEYTDCIEFPQGLKNIDDHGYSPQVIYRDENKVILKYSARGAWNPFGQWESYTMRDHLNQAMARIEMMIRRVGFHCEDITDIRLYYLHEQEPGCFVEEMNERWLRRHLDWDLRLVEQFSSPEWEIEMEVTAVF